MTMSETWRDGKLIWRLNETNKRVETMAADGVTVATWRDMTPEEAASADEYIAEVAARTARDAARAGVASILVDLKAEKDRVQLVIDKANASITGADTKDVARAAKRIADAAIDLARLVRDIP